MGSWSVGDVAHGVTGVLRKAANATGAGFDYLLKTATKESGLNPQAKARTSSAAGMFQFVEQTWLEVVAKNGAQHGLAREAAMIDRTAGGRYVVRDGQTRQDILALRYDADVSAKMAGAFTQQNQLQLSAGLGRAPSNGELYIAHFLGAQGATDLIRLAEANPGASAASRFPEAAAANRSIFYSGGEARSAKAVYDRLTAGYRVDSAATAIAAQAAAPSRGESDPEMLVAAYAEQGPVFHSMFHTGRRSPVSAYVQSVWENLPAAAPAAETRRVAAAPVANPDGPLPTPRPQTTRSPLAGRLGDVAAQPLDLGSFLKPDLLADAAGNAARASS